ncbi:diphthine--ammonia ligase [Candidatus Woesearchaeota archaeon]|nr:diphthine--ammonia ligase [Candidatus Woesearchaeota archaeon]
MCGILGIFNASGNVKEALLSMAERGRDGCGICDSSNCHYSPDIAGLPAITTNCMAHLLHSVVGCVNQPLKKKGIFIANCEIYNWNILDKKYSFNSRNDAELLMDLLEKKGISEEVLDELDGVYAVAYLGEGKVHIMRDILGVKPLWYSIEEGFCFASERKALVKLGLKKIEELNPRIIMSYDTKSGEAMQTRRQFLASSNLDSNYAAVTEKLLLEAVSKRIPDGKFGILFSGGIDSTFIAKICKDSGREFVCYAAGIKGERESFDIIQAKDAASRLGFKLKTIEISKEDVEQYLAKIVPLIEDSNVVKVGVGITMFAACELARKDGIKVIFSGLGSEELFAGYERHKNALDVNVECLSGLLKIYERDLYRDDVITMHNNLELRLPFLDKALARYALGIPAEMKILTERNKAILRDVAKKIGIPVDIAERKKKAAQYGSGFDRAIGKLARNEKMSKSAYLERFYRKPNVKLAALWSTGKDSAYAAWLMKKQNYEISCLICLKSANKDSYMFHTPNVGIANLHAESMKVPLIMKETAGTKEEELDDLRDALAEAKERYGIQGVVSGAIFSNYQRERIERVCDRLSLKIFSPLWHKDQEAVLGEISSNGFEAIIVSIAAEGLTKEWLGKRIDFDLIRKLKSLKGINISGEGGEYDSLVINCPLFTKPLKVLGSKIEEDTKNSARLHVECLL